MSSIFLVNAVVGTVKEEKAPPLGILYLSSYIRDRLQCDVSIYDTQIDQEEDRLFRDIARNPPLFVGVSSMTPAVNKMHSLARAIKGISPETKVVAGGPHATGCPEEVLRDGNIDFLVSGEGELALQPLVDHITGNPSSGESSGIWYREKDGSLHRGGRGNPVPCLDDLPHPAYELLPLNKYYEVPRIGIIFAHRRYATMATSRGCPYNCIYCHRIHGKEYRTYSPEVVLAQLKRLKKDFSVGEVVIVDDIFNLNSNRLKQICRLIIREKLGMKFSFPVGFRGDILDEEEIQLLKQAGMYRCMIAFETASPRLQRLIGKNLDLERVSDIVRKLYRLNIMTNGVFMLGLPTETFLEMKKTTSLALRSSLHTAVFVRPLPYPGTGLEKMVREQRGDQYKNFEDFNILRTQVNLSGVPEKEIVRLKRMTYLRFYRSPRRLWKIFQLLPNKKENILQILLNFFPRSFFW